MNKFDSSDGQVVEECVFTSEETKNTDQRVTIPLLEISVNQKPKIVSVISGMAAPTDNASASKQFATCAPQAESTLDEQGKSSAYQFTHWTDLFLL